MMPRVLLLLAAGVLFGCRAEMMEARGDSAPLPRTSFVKPGRGGVIRYPAGGPEAFRRARRKSADEQMAAFCKNGYTVTREGPWSKVGGDIPIGRATSVDFDQFLYVAFDCR